MLRNEWYPSGEPIPCGARKPWLRRRRLFLGGIGRHEAHGQEVAAARAPPTCRQQISELVLRMPAASYVRVCTWPAAWFLLQLVQPVQRILLVAVVVPSASVALVLLPLAS